MSILTLLGRLRRHCEGAALVEFAIVAPVMLTLYMMAFIVSDAISCNRKVTIATRVLTDVISRFASVQGSDVTNVLAATDKVLAPYSSANNPASLQISVVEVTSSTQASVVWSCASGGGTALPVGGNVALPANMVSSTMLPRTTPTAAPGAQLVMGVITYNYTPVFDWNGMGVMTFRDRIFLMPRVAPTLPLSDSC